MCEGMNKIEHLVVLMMENRSFDHYYGSYSLLEGRTDVDGLKETTPPLLDKDGQPVPFWDMGAAKFYSGYADPPHGWQHQHGNWNNGANDGFVTEFQKEFPTNPNGKSGSNIPVGYYTRETLPISYALADRFALCDRWFSSVLSSTWPNRKYLHSGQRDADNDTQTLPPWPGFKTTPFYNALEDTVDPATGSRLTWKNYFCDLPFLSFWYQFAAYHALGNFTGIADFVSACREDSLPTVSIIDPPFSLADDHPAHDVRLGQKFIGLIVDALTHSESWSKTALVLVYDENGAFYDHVPPPQSFEAAAGLAPEDDPLGFRVPAVVISPYAKQGVCSTVFDHTSLMKSIAVRWGVEFDPATYGTRWQNAQDIWQDCFAFDQAPLPMGTYTQTAAALAAGERSPMASINWGMGIHDLLATPAGGVEGFLERIFILPGLKALDHRAQVFDHLSSLEQGVIDLKRMAEPT